MYSSRFYWKHQVHALLFSGSLSDNHHIPLQWRQPPYTITMTSQWGSCRLKSPQTKLFIQSFVYANNIRKTSKPALLVLCEEIPLVTGGFPSPTASNVKSASMWWRHHDKFCGYGVIRTFRKKILRLCKIRSLLSDFLGGRTIICIFLPWKFHRWTDISRTCKSAIYMYNVIFTMRAPAYIKRNIISL